MSCLYQAIVKLDGGAVQMKNVDRTDREYGLSRLVSGTGTLHAVKS